MSQPPLHPAGPVNPNGTKPVPSSPALPTLTTSQVNAVVAFVAGAICLTIGAMSGAGAVNLLAAQRDFLAHAQRTMGTIQAVKEERFPDLLPGRGSRGHLGYVPTFEYMDQKEARHHATSEVESRDRDEYRIGQHMPVLYRTDRPWEAHLDSFSAAWRSIIITAATGMVFITGGVVSIWCGCKAWHKQPGPYTRRKRSGKS